MYIRIPEQRGSTLLNKIAFAKKTRGHQSSVCLQSPLCQSPQYPLPLSIPQFLELAHKVQKWSGVCPILIKFPPLFLIIKGPPHCTWLRVCMRMCIHTCTSITNQLICHSQIATPVTNDEIHSCGLQGQTCLSLALTVLKCSYIHTYIVCTYVHVCIYIYIHTYIHTYTYIHVHLHTYIHTYIHTYMYMYVHVCRQYVHTCTTIHSMYIHVYIHVRMYVLGTCMQTHWYIRIYN